MVLHWASVGGLVRGSPAFREATREVRRWDWRTLRDTAGAGAVATGFLEDLVRRGGPWTRIHQMDNLQKYLGKTSRCGTYTELLPEEVDEVARMGTTLSATQPQPVELGFNAVGCVCKAAYVTRLHSTGRHLFLAIGADGGLKTWYITPEFKDRSAYRGDAVYETRRSSPPGGGGGGGSRDRRDRRGYSRGGRGRNRGRGRGAAPRPVVAGA